MKKYIRNHKITIALLATAILVGCYNDSMESVDDFINHTKKKNQVGIEPLPPIKTYKGFVYGASAFRNPFEKDSSIKEISDSK